MNWDCSIQGFEGIRSQDILPLLLSQFHFELFVAYGNVIDPFVDRAFGHNFDATAQWDRDFIDRVHQRDEEAILAGWIKPVHMEAVVGKEIPERILCHPPLTPEFSVRWPDTVADSREIARLEGEVQHLKDEILRLQGEHVRLGEKLELAETKLI